MRALTKVIIITAYFFNCLPNIYTQTLTAEQIYKKVSGAVVVILAYDYNDELATQGSGVIINDEGYVVTNYHVLAGNERIEVLHNKEILPFLDIIGVDVEKDILILKIENNKIPAMKIGDSKTINIGERVYAIGSPLGFENTISEGIVSGLRNYDEFGGNFIQITASISPGSSGGAIVNDKGELIGISTLTAEEGQNLNFAIPINDVLNVEIRSYANDDSYKDFELFSKGWDAQKKGNYKEAIEYYSLYIIKYPNLPNAYNNRGNAKAKLEDYRGAIQDYNKAIKIKPDFAEAYYNRAGVKFNLEDFRGAIQDYNKAIKIKPDYANAYNNRGLTKGDLGDYRGAIQDYNKAIKIKPDFAEAYYNRAGVKVDLEDFRGAIQDYNKAIKIKPDDAGAYINRGLAKSHLGDYREAIQDYNKAINIKPDYASAYYNRGAAKTHLGDYRGAIQDNNKAIKIKPDYADAYNNRGLTKGDLGDYRGAIQDYNKAIEIEPAYIYAYLNRGLAKYKLGNKTGACLDWSKAGELGSDDAYDTIRRFCD